MKNGMMNSTTNINRVYYEEIDDVDIADVAEFYYHYNHYSLTDSMRKDYEDYEEAQIKLRNSIIKRAISKGLIPDHPDMSSVIFGVSSIKNKPVLIVRY